MDSLNQKLQQLHQILRSFPNLLIAYSGGVDSTFLLKVASDVLNTKACGIIGDSPSLPRQELQQALQMAKEFGWQVQVIPTREMEDWRYRQNDARRCYFCKKELFQEMLDYARQHRFAVIADGTNADDVRDYRPGRQAAQELQVRSPLLEAGLTKMEIRHLSRQMGLPTWNKPEMACLASRFPTGHPITITGLQKVEQAEMVLHKLGFRQVRVRHFQDRAHIEVEPEAVPRLLQPALQQKVKIALQHIGFRHVTIDPNGYRKGHVVQRKGKSFVQNASEDS